MMEILHLISWDCQMLAGSDRNVYICSEQLLRGEIWLK